MLIARSNVEDLREQFGRADLGADVVGGARREFCLSGPSQVTRSSCPISAWSWGGGLPQNLGGEWRMRGKVRNSAGKHLSSAKSRVKVTKLVKAKMSQNLNLPRYRHPTALCPLEVFILNDNLVRTSRLDVQLIARANYQASLWPSYGADLSVAPEC